jgi:hypothetical protein
MPRQPDPTYEQLIPWLATEVPETRPLYEEYLRDMAVNFSCGWLRAVAKHRNARQAAPTG